MSRSFSKFLTFLFGCIFLESEAQSTCSVDYVRLQTVIQNLTDVGYESQNCSMLYEKNSSTTYLYANTAWIENV